MKEIVIPKDLQSCVEIELFQQFLMGKTVAATLTPGIKESLKQISEYFFREIDKIAKENKTEEFFQEEEWELQANFGFRYSMPAGHYVKIDEVIHLVLPVF